MTESSDRWTAVAALLAAAGVVTGAFGAHGLRSAVSAADLETWRTAAQYHLVHAVGLGLVALAARRRAARLVTIAGCLLTAGVVVFSGSLYLLVLTGQRWLGAVTPFGGVALITGWLALAVAVSRRPPD